MNFVRLNHRYRLYAFSDYRSMKSALPYMRQVTLAKNLQEVEEPEARRYVGRVDGKGFQNYLQPLGGQQTKTSGKASLITALQVLYKSNGFSARYIVVERG
ncbi:hypothetical protein H9Q13_07965 [Pontibacter sp. JH31]|uniref:Uncharacterized protein n=1 Tax=Pontibacter aquaedesilientis TaxID=2766980 RepID=A0ABR7XFM2_9BACT|nr:hypothetical protein [Pontibacter aquaedesilientis]MBD1397098.1 hypothetical protein [Pontibacter aquaedesilientis]